MQGGNYSCSTNGISTSCQPEQMRPYRAPHRGGGVMPGVVVKTCLCQHLQAVASHCGKQPSRIQVLFSSRTDTIYQKIPLFGVPARPIMCQEISLTEKQSIRRDRRGPGKKNGPADKREDRKNSIGKRLRATQITPLSKETCMARTGQTVTHRPQPVHLSTSKSTAISGRTIWRAPEGQMPVQAPH